MTYTAAHEDLWKFPGMKVAGASRARPLREASRLANLLSERGTRTTVWSKALQLGFHKS